MKKKTHPMSPPQEPEGKPRVLARLTACELGRVEGGRFHKVLSGYDNREMTNVLADGD